MSNTKDLENSSSLLHLLTYTFDKVKQLADANSVLGEKIQVNNMTIIPVSKVSVGFAGGGADMLDVNKKKRKTPMGSGGSVSLTPLTFLVIAENDVQLIDISVSEEKMSTMTEIIASVVKQFANSKKTKTEE